MQQKEPPTASKPTKRFWTNKKKVYGHDQFIITVTISDESRKEFGCQLGNGIFLEDFYINENWHNQNESYCEVKSLSCGHISRELGKLGYKIYEI
jgi:hypothetical protein